MHSQNSFVVAISAFQQATPKFIEEFAREGTAELDLVRYFLSILEPKDVKEVAEALSEETLLEIFKTDFQNFESKIEERRRNRIKSSYFDAKSSMYWRSISHTKICKFIKYLIKDKSEHKLASQFLLILPSSVISQLNVLADLSGDDERNLYLALGDNIYELPIVSPKIYSHMLDLFQENMEIFFILQTMEELIKRKAMVIDTTETIINSYKKHGYALSIQAIYSELYGLEIELVVEILGQLREKGVLSLPEKNSLQKLFEGGGIDFIKGMKSEILSRSGN